MSLSLSMGVGDMNRITIPIIAVMVMEAHFLFKAIDVADDLDLPQVSLPSGA